MRIKKTSFIKRKERVRSKLKKVSNRNRLSVFKSGRHIYAQIIDDISSETLVSASTLDKTIRVDAKSNCNKEFAVKVGRLLADRAEKKSIKLVCFDKGGHKYHGVIKALADEARKKIQF
ncbi:MAG TPA: 50S ribosomal protein L18 [Candidatus Megaira endosymbiont of Nemacystus decipiens]|nr:50S ribosomal protein L18 [Candidatus Megaera endosymbiont of Nemacystus decipiens]